MKQTSRLITLKGDSMHPLIKNGAKVIINFHFSNLTIGDIVVFLKDDKFIAHRLIKKRQGLLFTKGDNVSHMDAPLREEQILGKVEKVVYPDYIIDLRTTKNKIFRYFFVLYSYLTLYFPPALKLRQLYRIPTLKSFYRFWVQK